MALKVLVVGAGPCGLNALKEMLEAGMDADCVDFLPKIGGLWGNPTNAYDDLWLTVSNQFMAYSDFPISESTTLKYSSRVEYNQYLNDYCDHHGLRKHIHFNTKLIKAERTTDGKWACTFEGELDWRLYDKMVVASGSNATPKPISLPGYTGQVMHSSEYRDASAFAGKHVMTIGTGESGADIAVECGQKAMSTTTFARRYPLLAPRFPALAMKSSDHDEYGHMVAADKLKLGCEVFLETATTGRLVNSTGLWFYGSMRQFFWSVLSKYVKSATDPVTPLCKWALGATAMTASKAPTTWGQWLQADQGGFATKNMRLSHSVARGEVNLAVGSSFTCSGTKVTFNDVVWWENQTTGKCTKEIEVDAIILCTGYQTTFPFLPDDIPPNPRMWYKHAYPPKYGEDLVFVGWARPHQGGIPQCAEMLARYTAMQWAGKLTLPADYEKLALEEAEKERQFFHLTPELNALVDYHSFMEALAREVGCVPKMPLTPMRFLKFWLMPGWCTWYRKDGPSAKPDMVWKVMNRYSVLPIILDPLIFAQIMYYIFIQQFLNIIIKSSSIGKSALKAWHLPKKHFLHGYDFHWADVFAMGTP